MTYKVPRPKMSLANLLLLDAVRGGATLDRPITMTVEGVPASISPSPTDRARGPWQQLCWSYAGVSDRTRKVEIAMQAILVQAILAEPPAPIAFDDLEPLRLQPRLADVDDAVVVYRDLLLRRTGVAWSVRVGPSKNRSTITIAAMPRARTAASASSPGAMSLVDSALLAALSGRQSVNPLTGIQVQPMIGKRLELAGLIAGVELVSARRVAQ
jgi:hypothetical protein